MLLFTLCKKKLTFDDMATDCLPLLRLIGIIILVLVILQSFENRSINYYSLSAKVWAILPPPQAFSVYNHWVGCWLVIIQWNQVIKGSSPGDLISAISHSLVSGGAFGENSNTTSVSSEFWDLASNSVMPTLTSDSLLIFKTFQSSIIPENRETITSCANILSLMQAGTQNSQIPKKVGYYLKSK